MNNQFQGFLLGFQTVTVEIYYRIPDHTDLLQLFWWQLEDKPPEFPRLNNFLNFWRENIDGKIHSVRAAVLGHFKPTELTLVDAEYRLM
jgi:uncharacterized protein Usg